MLHSFQMALRFVARRMLRSAAAARIFSTSRQLTRNAYSSSFYPSASSSSSFKLNWLWPASLVLTAAGSAPLLLCQDDAQSGEIVTQERAKSLPSSFVEELRSTCGADGVSLDEDERSFHSKSVSNFHPVIEIPDVVVYPRCQEDVVAIVKVCSKYKIPIVPYGGATSLEGQILSPWGGVSMDMRKMKRIIKLNVDDMDVVVEPGIGWLELNDYLKPYGLFFPLDPGPGASIGGMCATRCSGSLAVRYFTL